MDEAFKDPSFVEFRKQLVRAAEIRDLEFLLGILDPEIKNSFGGNGGIEEFKEMWKPERQDTQLWATLLKVLSMGGSCSRTDQDVTFTAPYVFSRWNGDFDAFEYAAITAKAVNLRGTPQAAAPVLARLSYDIVKLEGSPSGPSEFDYAGNGPWIRIKTLDGISGYVSSRFVYSPIDYRIRFVMQNGKWRMNFFLNGD